MKIVAEGTIGTAVFEYSIDGRPALPAMPIRPVVDIRENLRLLFYAGVKGATFVAGDIYQFTTEMGESVKIADRNIPNIYVQYDYLDYDKPGNACSVDSDCEDGSNQPNAVCHSGYCNHNHYPGDPLFRKVVEEFAGHGITLYIDPLHDAVPHAQVVTFSRPGDGTNGSLAACAGASF